MMLWCDRWESCRLRHQSVRSWALKLKEWKGFIGRLFFDGGKLTQDKSNTATEMQQLLLCSLNIRWFVKIFRVRSLSYEYQFSFILKAELVTINISHFDLPLKPKLRGTRKWSLKRFSCLYMRSSCGTFESKYISVLLTYITDEELSSHCNVSIPRPWVNSYISSSERWLEEIFFNRVLVFVAWEDLFKKRNKNVM